MRLVRFGEAAVPRTSGQTELSFSRFGVDHRCDQTFQGGCRIATSARVDRRGLDHRAARGHQPFETSTLRELANWPGFVAAATDERNGSQMSSDEFEVNRGIECEEPRLV